MSRQAQLKDSSAATATATVATAVAGSSSDESGTEDDEEDNHDDENNNVYSDKMTFRELRDALKKHGLKFKPVYTKVDMVGLLNNQQKQQAKSGSESSESDTDTVSAPAVKASKVQSKSSLFLSTSASKVNYNDMNFIQLREQIKKRGLLFKRKYTKDDLISLCQNTPLPSRHALQAVASEESSDDSELESEKEDEVPKQVMMPKKVYAITASKTSKTSGSGNENNDEDDDDDEDEDEDDEFLTPMTIADIETMKFNDIRSRLNRLGVSFGRKDKREQIVLLLTKALKEKKRNQKMSVSLEFTIRVTRTRLKKLSLQQRLRQPHVETNMALRDV